VPQGVQWRCWRKQPHGWGDCADLASGARADHDDLRKLEPAPSSKRAPAAMNDDQPLMLVTTTGDRALAERIAIELVDQRLAACVQVDGPITSIFRWQREIETAEEYRLSIKTCQHRLPAAIDLIKARHNYDVPEIVVLEISAGTSDYLDWLRSETNAQQPTQ
jgi:periplasmic divalent cation tolerance protein